MERITVSKHQRLGYVHIEQDSEFVGKTTGLSVYCGLNYDGDDIWAEALDKKQSQKGLYRRAMYLGLSKDKDYDTAYTIDMVSVDNAYQGWGIAPKVYRKLLKAKPDLLLRAGTVQSPGGRYIWYNLAQFEDIVVFARAHNGRIYPLDTDHDLKELCLAHAELYDNEQREYDVFACAAR